MGVLRDNPSMPPSAAPDTATFAIHGAGGGAWEWTIWQRVWSAQRRALLAPDLRPAATGLAQTHLSDYIGQMRGELQPLQRPHLIGASLGGLIALALANDVDAASLILVDALPPLGISPRPEGRQEPGAVIPWGSRRRFESTRRALPDADAAVWHYAFRRWRDESAAVVREAVAGFATPVPRCRVLVIAATLDEAIPAAASRRLAQHLGADFWPCPCSHAGALLGRPAADLARRALAWTQHETPYTDPSQVPLETE